MLSKENIKTVKYHFFDETLVLSIICDKCGSNDEKVFTEKELFN